MLNVNLIKKNQIDGGGEFANTQLTSHLQQQGIIHQFSCPHTLEQNDTIERHH